MDTDATIKNLKETIRVQERKIANIELAMRRLEMKFLKDKENRRAEVHNLSASIRQLQRSAQ